MPLLKDIKISQEINFNGLPTWVSIGGDLLENEDPKEALRHIQKVISEYQQEEHKAYSQSKWAKADKPQVSLMDELANCKTLAEIQSYRLTIKNQDEQELYYTMLNELSNQQK